MALELRQQLKLSQQLVMTPQLQQAIKLLQLSRVELLETVQQELLENPFLEEAPANEPVAPQDQEESRHEKPQDEVYDEDLSRNADWEEYLGEFASTPRTSQGRELEIAEEISPLEARYSAKPTLEGHLLWQLHLSTLTDEQKEIGEIIIGNLGSSGYLRASVEEIAEMASTTPEAVQTVLERVQLFDPVGVAARDARECLLVQLKNLRYDRDPILLELVQGEGGVMALDPEYVQAVRALCDEKDLILIVDEVQTGVGRTGTFLCCEHYNLKPDIVTLAKGLGGGLPIGAVLMNEKVAEGMGPGSHGSTFGGNPVVCAGANVVVDRMDQSFLANVSERAVQLRAGLAKLPMVKNLSGIGLMVGIEFFGGIQAADVLAACREKGLLVLTAKSRLRLLPPLTLTAHDVEKALGILNEVLTEMEQKAPKEQA